MVLRSLLYTPAYRKKYMSSALGSGSDALIIDLEDSVPDIFKEEARKNIRDFLDLGLFAGHTTFIRLNPIESKLLFRDLESVFHPDVTGFMLTKIYSADDMIYYDKLISQLEIENGIEPCHFSFIPLIETTAAVMDVYKIAKASSRTVAIAFGGEDFLDNLTGIHGTPPRAFDYPRAAIALAARSARVLPIDTPYLTLDDEDGFMKEESISFEMGFAGCQLIHPKQIKLANKCFTPSEEEVSRSYSIVEAIKLSEQKGSGVAMLDGMMIGPPMRKRAEKVIKYMESLEKHI